MLLAPAGGASVHGKHSDNMFGRNASDF
jgi:hypothetical protein